MPIRVVTRQSLVLGTWSFVRPASMVLRPAHHGPRTRDGPRTKNEGPRTSSERPLLELEAFLDLLDRRAGPTVFIFDVGGDRPAFFFEELQDLADRGVAFTPRRVVALMLFSILDVEVRDVGVMRLDVRDRVEVGGNEVSDVQIDLEVLRQLHRGGEAIGRRELVGIGD